MFSIYQRRLDFATLHAMQATYFQVAEEEMQASQELVPHDANQRRASRHHANANLVSMLSGGVLLVRFALVVVACSLPGGVLLLLHAGSGASVLAPPLSKELSWVWALQDSQRRRL